jgi:hypothetical protein
MFEGGTTTIQATKVVKKGPRKPKNTASSVRVSERNQNNRKKK